MMEHVMQKQEERLHVTCGSRYSEEQVLPEIKAKM